MELHITRGSNTRASYLIGLNLGLTQVVLVATLLAGTFHDRIDYADLVFEGASAVVSFGLFVAAALVRVKAAKMPTLLLGLFFFQIGSMLDVVDEVVSFSFDFWSVTGDLLRLVGEIMLAVVAFHFVGVTSTIANTDPLTGLHNKSFHGRRLMEELEDAGGQEGCVAVIAIDLDKFKLINDKFGHSVGDEVLKHVANLLKGYMKAHRGVASRTGGEEFELLLFATDEQRALKVAEDVRALIATNPPKAVSRVTASIGVALNLGTESPAALRKRADGAAYMAKQSGRDRVTLAGVDQRITTIHSN